MTSPTRTETHLGALAEHRELLSQIADLRQFWREVCQLGDGPKFGEMASRVTNIRSLLQHHFEREECGGYLSSALKTAPQFADEAAQLQMQHAGFLASLDQLIDCLKRSQCGSWQGAFAGFEQFVEDLQKHEQREHTLLQTAFNQDEGEGD